MVLGAWMVGVDRSHPVSTHQGYVSTDRARVLLGGMQPRSQQGPVSQLRTDWGRCQESQLRGSPPISSGHRLAVRGSSDSASPRTGGQGHPGTEVASPHVECVCLLCVDGAFPGKHTSPRAQVLTCGLTVSHLEEASFPLLSSPEPAFSRALGASPASCARAWLVPQALVQSLCSPVLSRLSQPPGPAGVCHGHHHLPCVFLLFSRLFRAT